jgi:anti-sigma-K factor RskA
MMAPRDHFADDLPLYALDALEGEECVTVEKHLRECSDCRSEVEQLREDWSLIALSASGPPAPPRSRERLISAIGREPRELPIRVRKRPVWLNALEWAAVAAAIIAIVFLAHQNNRLRDQLTSLQARSTADAQRLRQANELLTALTSGDAEHFTLVASNVPPQPHGKAIYDPRSGTLVFLATNMPAIPSHKAYQLWLIPANGAAPISAGIFKPNAQGTATVIKPPLQTRVDAKTFAITVEPETGSPAPTSKPIMVGTRG